MRAVVFSNTASDCAGEVPLARILIIDDEEAGRDLLRDVLEAEGHEVVEASDGQQGSRLYRQRPTDLIITDVYMPNQEGLATIRELKRDFPDAKFIAMSGGSSVVKMDVLRIAERLGAVRTLTKPFGINELVAAVKEALGA
jgi:CheY-like chemotaxis protein